MRGPDRAAALGLEVEGIERRLADGRNLPTRCYLDAAIFDLEMEAIFDRSWQYFAPIDTLATPGSVRVGMIGRTPVVVSRDGRGRLHGFVNICRHRAFTVVDDDRTCSVLQCGYHGWIYGLDGRLRRAAGTEDDPEFDAGATSLHPVSVTEWGHAIWVHPQPDADDLTVVHPRLDGIAERLHVDHTLGRFATVHRSVTTQAANWKLWYDNGTECYHCPRIHRDSFGSAYDTNRGATTLEMTDQIYGSEFRPDPEAERSLDDGSYRSLQPFPGTQYIQQRGLMVMARIVPNGHASTTFVVDYLAENGTEPTRAEEWITLWERTFAEDARVVERVQENLGSGRVTEMRYVAGREDPSRFIHGLVWQAYRAHLRV